MLKLIGKIPVYFHSNMRIQHMCPAQGMEGTPQVILMRKPFGVQHLLMLIQICKHGVSVMTCVHLKVQFRFSRKTNFPIDFVKCFNFTYFYLSLSSSK